jgi:hypothetical protein
MGWRKRVRQIAATNPDKLHPIIQRARSDSREKCWDRADWQKEPQSGGRPIHLVLSWLASKSLLTPAGDAELAKAKRGEYASLFLAPSLVSTRAAEFLSRHYRAWYENGGINFGVDPSMPLEDAELERLWQAFLAA